MTESVLVFNAGSSSIKYQLIDTQDRAMLASGLCERVGTADAVLHHRTQDSEYSASVDATDHTCAVHAVIDAFTTYGPDLNTSNIVGVGHRVVMGGAELYAPKVITDAVLAQIDALAPLAPLHNPANAAAIRVARTLLSDVRHVAVFDTAFFHDLPAPAAHYAINPEFAERHGIRRYGFHGISHEYVSQTVTKHLAGSDTLTGTALRQVVLHLGNGASASAVVGGRPVDTSMGLTPLEGLVMGSRSGDLDPAVAFYLYRELGMGIDAIDHLLNYESGLKGMTGTNDVRDIQGRIKRGDRAARAAMDIYVHRLVKYVGGYAAVMGGIDALSFTAGVGEHDAQLRAEVCRRLGFLGITIDPARNDVSAVDEALVDPLRAISDPSAPVTVFVVPTQEEQSIARQVVTLLT